MNELRGDRILTKGRRKHAVESREPHECGFIRDVAPLLRLIEPFYFGDERVEADGGQHLIERPPFRFDAAAGADVDETKFGRAPEGL